MARGSTGRGSRLAGAGFLLPAAGPGPGQQEPGANTVTWGFPVTVVLVAVACGNVGRAFCARSECRCRPGRLRACRQARAAESAAAASASSVEVAVTWVDVMDRMAWCRPAVKDSSSA